MEGLGGSGDAADEAAAAHGHDQGVQVACSQGADLTHELQADGALGVGNGAGNGSGQCV